jgi:RIO-like serine/threonine protein kinase
VTIPNVVLTAALDRRVRRDDIRVYVFLYTQLDVFTYRAVKHAWLARRVAIARPNVARSLSRLITYGYLERGEPDGPLNTYRLTMSAPEVPAAERQQRGDRRDDPRGEDRRTS